MKKFLITTIGLVTLLIITGCETDAEIASYNVSKEADMFRVKRRITFINLRSDEYLFSLIGNCSIETDTNDNQLEVTCKVGDDKYQKHFLRLSEEDKVLKEKKQILTDMYTPSFKPRSYVPRNMNLENLKKKNYMSQNEVEEGEEEDEDNEKKKRKRRKKHKKRSDDSDEEDEDEDEEDEDEDEEGEEEEDDEEEGEGEEDDFDYKQDTMKYADDDVQDALRNQLFHKKKK